MDKDTYTLVGKFECCGIIMVIVIIDGRGTCVVPELGYNSINFENYISFCYGNSVYIKCKDFDDALNNKGFIFKSTGKGLVHAIIMCGFFKIETN